MACTLASAFFIATASYFLAPHGAVFFGVFFVAMVALSQRMDPLVLGIFALFMVPAQDTPFFALPGINYLIPMSVPFILAVLLFGPTYFRQGRQALKGAGIIDVLALTAIVGFILLDFRASTFTNSLRGGIYSFLTIGLAYLAFSRAVQSRAALEKIVRTFVIALLVTACIGIVCQALYWNFYSYKMLDVFGVPISGKSRGTLLRVTSTYGYGYINYGLVLMSATLLSVVTVAKMRSTLFKAGFIALMVFGVLMTASRGPFVAGAAGAFVIILALKNPFGRFFQAGMAAVVILIAASFTEQGQALYSYLPFVGDSDTEDYRVQLAEISWPIILDNALTGDPFYLDREEMQVLIQGEGIIDIVNSYTGKALAYGLPLATMFGLAHILAGLFAVRTARRVDPNDGTWRLLGGGLAGALACYVVGIATTSLRFQTEEFGFILVALDVAYVRISWAYGLAKSKRSQLEDAIPAYGT